MAGTPLGGEKESLVIDAWKRLRSCNAVQEETGVDRATVKRVIRRAGLESLRADSEPRTRFMSPDSEPVPPIVAELMREREAPRPAPDAPPEPDEPAPRGYSHTEDGDGATVEYAIGRPIRTLEDALAFAEVDLKVWRVEKWSATSWETGMKLRRFDERGKVVNEAPHRTHQWRVKLDLRRILPKHVQDATDAIFEAMKVYAPKYPKLAPRKTPARPHLCVVDLFDVHFGKLAWSPETGENYDLKIAETLYRNAVIDLMNESATYEIEHFLVPFGNDFLHIDSAQNTTTNGTPQDTDGRFAKIFETGERAVIWAIEQLAAIAPVSVLLVPGNHDRHTSYALCRVVSAWFRHCEHVSVDSTPIPRKRFRYGTTLLGFTHGNEEKHAALPTIMATEWKQDWAETDCHEFHLGHQHRSRKMVTTPVDTHEGVVIRTLMSLSASDAWHHRKAYVGSTKAAEAYIYRKDAGFVANFVAKARME